jgi:hypothetical protein
MIPEQELNMLASCIQDAWHLADAGCINEGYTVLDLGLLWAETPPLDPVTFQWDEPDAWSVELQARYRAELMRYALAHPSAVPRMPEDVPAVVGEDP